MKRYLYYIIALMLIAFSLVSYSAPAKSYWNQWVPFNPLSTKIITYPAWKNFLKQYAITKNDQVFIEYAKVSNQSKQALRNEINHLSEIPIGQYNRNTQLAYWINLYNMETVYLVLQHYPVSSITKIKSSFFGFGPWDKKVLKVDGIQLTLNDIEHRIIRPIWNDPRIHAAVNCASISCPNLLTIPYDAKNIYKQLNEAFSDFVNSSKGVEIKGNTLELSKIFEWYGVDFGNTDADIKNFIAYYLTSQKLKKEILNTNKIIYKNYNWDLNGIK